jgi:TonB-linked SusC/RagA family outer membrane protein
MRIKLCEIFNGLKYLPLGVLFQFLFTGALQAAEKTVPDSLRKTALEINQEIIITGRVTSANDHLGIPGANVVVKNVPNAVAVTDMDGKYVIKVPSADAVLVFTSVGFKTLEIRVEGNSEINAVMKQDQTDLGEVIIIGYGKQKKASLVAAITQVSGKTLERAGGVQSIGAALTGNAPGLVTSASSGMPGEEDPQIFIRGASTWNNAQPLILVDGVERPMNSVEITSVESVTVLKDASATAVYGVKGGNGVILITTKRGQSGKALIRATFNTTMKVPSKLPEKLDSYDGLIVKNRAIENELALSPSSWNDYVPQAIINKYRYPANVAESERYPNVDWQDALFNDFAMSYNTSLNVSGGTKSVRYFASADFLSEGDLFKKYNNNRGYDPGYGYNRLNVRSNLDFQITSSTVFKVGLAGSRGVKKSPWGASGGEYTMWDAAYSTAPDVFLPYYEDGSWGYFAPNEGKASNSVRNLAISGIQFVTTTKLNTDFTLEQNFDKWVKGLSFKGLLALDNSFVEGDRGVSDLYNDVQEKYIDPLTGLVLYKKAYDNNNRFDFQEGVKWTSTGGTIRDWNTYRKLFYQLQLNYQTKIAENHNIAAMGLFSRDKDALGSEIPHYREDWVFRATYNYANKYFIEYNGAYNGSEKFGPENRFEFFSSGGASWIVSKENFMKKTESFLDLLKFRASYGQVGDDGGYQRNLAQRFIYQSQWGYGGKSHLGTTGETAEESPYTWYNELSVANPGIHWEIAKKVNVGADFGFFKGLVSGTFDWYREDRTDVLLPGNQRAIPPYFGATAPIANLGQVENRGYELELKFNYTFGSGLNVWWTTNFSHSKNKIITADDPELFPDYQKKQGYSVNQAHSYVSHGYYNTWDELYASTIHSTNDAAKLPGNYNILDYNADGIIDAKDNIPYGYTGTPQNTYNNTVGVNWKGFSAFVQFYGVNNVTRQVVLTSLGSQNHVVYDQGSYWSQDNTNADQPMPRWLATASEFNNGSRYMYDGSYLRLKNAEIAYTFDGKTNWIKSAGLQSIRFYFNGNNLFLWSNMPDDREANYAGTGWASQGAYPTVKRFNFGANIIF